MNRTLLGPALLLLAAGCGGADGRNVPAEDGAEPPAGLRVETLLLAPDVFEDVIEVTGSVEAIHDATLSAQSSGTVESLAPLGKIVRQGEVVARLDQGFVIAALDQAKAQVATARASADLARDNFDRQEPLFQDSIISALEFQQLRAQLQQAEATLHSAEALHTQASEQLENTEVLAPFAGRVESHFVEMGEQVAPGVNVARIVDASRVRVVAGIPERFAGDIELGTEILFSVEAYRGEPRTGRVTFAGSTINPRSRTYAVEAEIGNSDGRLKPEMIVEARVLRERIDSVLVVPRVAVVRDEDGSSVFVVDRSRERASVMRRYVTTGPVYAGRVVIQSGLQAGEEVVVAGQNTLTAGEPVVVDIRYEKLDAQGIPLQ